MTNRVNGKQMRRKKPKVEAAHHDVNEGVPDFSACEVSDFKEELKALRESAQSRAIHLAADGLDAYYHVRDLKDEIMKLKGEMEITIRSVQESKFYSDFVEQLCKSEIMKRNMNRVLGGRLDMDMVIYGLGSIQYSYVSQYQLALAISLKRQFPHRFEAIEVYDPLFTYADKRTMEMLGCKVATVNELCKKQVKKPTLFCLPYVVTDCISNLLEANWCPARLNKMVILGPSFNYLAALFSIDRSGAAEAKFSGDLLKQRYEYIEAIHEYTIEVEVVVPKLYRPMFRWCTWHFFSLDARLDLNRLLPCDIPTRVAFLHRRLYDNWLKKRRNHLGDESINLLHQNSLCVQDLELPFKGTDPKSCPCEWASDSLTIRNTREKRCLWKPPFTGWVKLNFSGKGCGKDTRAGLGGVFYDAQMRCLAVYCGSLEKADPVVAGVEALRWGLKNLKMVLSPAATKLVVEGDDLQVIRWLNRGPDPPSRIAKPLSQIFEMLERIKPVIRHVYEEANVVAIELAEKGATLENPSIWLCEKNDTVFVRRNVPA